MLLDNSSNLGICFRIFTLVISLYAVPAHALDFFVDSASDDVDNTPGNGTCDTIIGECTLRAAIQEVTQGSTSTIYNIYLLANTYILDLNGAELIADAGDLNIDSSGSTILITAQSGTNASNVIIESGALTDRIFHIMDAASVTFRNITIQNANTTVIGGAIYNVSGGSLTLDGVVLNNNATSAANGGGAIYSNSGTTTISDSTLSNNQASSGWGGAIYNAAGSTLTVSTTTFNNNGANSAGGAIYHANTTANSLSISESTFQSNSSSTSGGGLHNAGGASINGSLFTQNSVLANGAIFGGGGIANSSTLTIKNTTISENQTLAYGGGIHNGNSASANLTLNNVTITGNSADLDNDSIGDGGGLYADTSTTVNYSNTIIANNTDASSEAPDCGGASITSLGNNIVGNILGCSIGGTQSNDQTGDPLLAALADNGGPTLTHALNTGSIAIDAGNQNIPDGNAPNCETTDQRGFSRPVDGDSDLVAYCDIGAYELDPNSSGTPITGGGCYIATAAYGTGMEKDVVTLRRFRDRYLLSNEPGKLFTELYYKLSPPVATRISSSNTLREWARASLIPLVSLGRILGEPEPTQR
ncbi:MAG: CFI-box-CTERM domain-containing protein [Acidiferrobacterales bacterium]